MTTIKQLLIEKKLELAKKKPNPQKINDISDYIIFQQDCTIEHYRLMIYALFASVFMALIAITLLCNITGGYC